MILIYIVFDFDRFECEGERIKSLSSFLLLFLLDTMLLTTVLVNCVYIFTGQPVV